MSMLEDTERKQEKPQRKPWVEPQVCMLAVEETAHGFMGMGGDFQGVGQFYPDCTVS